MFTDEAIITVKGGDGGKGCVSWRREKFVSKGGPDGGDGGKGGDIILKVSVHTDTLSEFARVKSFRAESGKNGSGKDKRGRSAEDRILLVPPGTVVREPGEDSKTPRFQDSKNVIADLQKEGDEVIVAKGGRGGYGNAHFTSSIRQRPDFAELGEPGEERNLHLELKLVADVAIIGYPNVGKSTLISVISSAKPKIAGYPFTTLVPNLGVVHVGDRSFVACDIPGLIEGAAEGKGLGHTFLRHIERCSVILHLLDVSREDLEEDFRAIRRELERYSSKLAKKRELVTLSKTDLASSGTEKIQKKLQKSGIHVFAAISSVTHEGIEELLKRLLPIVLEEREKQRINEETNKRSNPLPVLRPHLEGTKTGAFTMDVQKDGKGEIQTVTVHGKRIEQIAVMTNWNVPSAVRRFRDVCERSGLRKALEKTGADAATRIFIGKTEITEYF